MKFLYYQTIVQVRVPINDDGTVGRPEIVKRFVSEMKDNYKQTKVKKQKKQEEQKKFLFAEKSDTLEL